MLGNRKLLAFFITISIFSAAVLTALWILRPTSLDFVSLITTLATSYATLSGLFFGSNILEHFSKKKNEDSN